MRRSTTKQEKQCTREMEGGSLSSAMEGLALCQPCALTWKVEEENVTSSRNWWYKHSKVFTSSGERKQSVRIICLIDASACSVAMGTAIFFPSFMVTS